MSLYNEIKTGTRTKYLEIMRNKTIKEQGNKSFVKRLSRGDLSFRLSGIKIKGYRILARKSLVPISRLYFVLDFGRHVRRIRSLKDV